MSHAWDDLRSTGLLWLINTTVFHPRGFALALHFDDGGDCTGWSLLGDGQERWTYSEDGWPEGEGLDDAFRAAMAFMSPDAAR
jgi:hypothetical protein